MRIAVLAVVLAAGCRVDRIETCDDGIQNGAETDVDCGGICQPCGYKKLCDVTANCATGLHCVSGRCNPGVDVDLAMAPPPDLAVPPPRGTGVPCTKAPDCDGTKAICITKDTNFVTWPDGYCTSGCAHDGDCPGGPATCVAPGTCMVACTAAGGAMPCARAGYACLEGCAPAAESQCDPAQCGANGCAQGMACVRIGADDVGRCGAACDPFAQACALGEGCYPSAECGGAACIPAGAGGDGHACHGAWGCAPGLTCFQGACRPVCGGAKQVNCTNGKQCIDLSPTVKMTTVGVCAG